MYTTETRGVLHCSIQERDINGKVEDKLLKRVAGIYRRWDKKRRGMPVGIKENL